MQSLVSQKCRQSVCVCFRRGWAHASRRQLGSLSNYAFPVQRHSMLQGRHSPSMENNGARAFSSSAPANAKRRSRIPQPVRSELWNTSSSRKTTGVLNTSLATPSLKRQASVQPSNISQDLTCNEINLLSSKEPYKYPQCEAHRGFMPTPTPQPGPNAVRSQQLGVEALSLSDFATNNVLPSASEIAMPQPTRIPTALHDHASDDCCKPSCPQNREPVKELHNLYKRFSCLDDLLEQNKIWATSMTYDRPDYFERLAEQQQPKLLWIGCSDSRVPANDIVALEPGELFVHRNIANVVTSHDMNCLSVLQYAVEVLKIRHIIVCGHYGCGGVLASMQKLQSGVIDNWLRVIKDLYNDHENQFESLDERGKQNLLCELNVANSVRNVASTTIVQNAWQRDQELSVHGWIYGLNDGIIHDLGITVDSEHQIKDIYTRMAKKRGPEH